MTQFGFKNVVFPMVVEMVIYGKLMKNGGDFMRIIGMRKEIYIGQSISGHNCDFVYEDAEFTKHIICARLDDNTKIEIELSNSEGECGSGWCSASWGDCNVKKVDNFIFTHRPIKPILVKDIPLNGIDDWSNEVFSFSYDGGDSYYPSGYYNVNEELFEASDRHKEQRMVWIIIGDSSLGKSYVTSKLSGLSVLETDSLEYGYISDEIKEDIVVIGNRHDIKVEYVVEKLFGNPEVVIVEFKSYDKN